MIKGIQLFVILTLFFGRFNNLDAAKVSPNSYAAGLLNGQADLQQDFVNALKGNNLLWMKDILAGLHDYSFIINNDVLIKLHAFFTFLSANKSVNSDNFFEKGLVAGSDFNQFISFGPEQLNLLAEGHRQEWLEVIRGWLNAAINVLNNRRQKSSLNSAFPALRSDSSRFELSRSNPPSPTRRAPARSAAGSSANRRQSQLQSGVTVIR